MSDPDDPNPPEPTSRATWALIPVAFTAVSAVGFLGGLLLYPLDYEEEGVWDDVFFALLALGWIAAFVSGLLAYVIGRRSRNRRAKRVGLIALGWFVLVLVIESIHQAVG
jgi:hypothetical protein